MQTQKRIAQPLIQPFTNFWNGSFIIKQIRTDEIANDLAALCLLIMVNVNTILSIGHKIDIKHGFASCEVNRMYCYDYNYFSMHPKYIGNILSA